MTILVISHDCDWLGLRNNLSRDLIVRNNKSHDTQNVIISFIRAFDWLKMQGKHEIV